MLGVLKAGEISANKTHINELQYIVVVVFRLQWLRIHFISPLQYFLRDFRKF